MFFYLMGCGRSRLTFLTASKYCGSGLKIDLVVVVVILVVVITLLSKSTAFVSLKGNRHILFNGNIFIALNLLRSRRI